MSCQFVTLLAAQVPVGFWIWAIVALAIAVLAGFLAGHYVAGLSEAVPQSPQVLSLEELLGQLKQHSGNLRDGLGVLERRYAAELEEVSLQELVNEQARQSQQLQSLRERRQAVLAERERILKARPSREYHLDWIRCGLDAATGLPDRASFDANLHALVQAVTVNHRSAGILLLRLDRYENLQSRFGDDAAVLLRKLGSIAIRHARDADLVCRYAADTLGILLPSLDADETGRIAGALHAAVREHRFRIDETGSEVLVTACLGGSVCLPDEPADLALSRAGEALAQAARKGRNQWQLLPAADFARHRSA